jgi:sporulation integral membrane protein YtvI
MSALSDRFQKHYYILTTIVIIAIILWLLLTRMLILMLPFLIAGLIAWFIDPLVNFLERRKIPRGVGALSILLAMAMLLGLLIFFIINRIIIELTNLTYALPRFASVMSRSIGQLLRQAEEYYFDLPPDVIAVIQTNINSLLSSITRWATQASAYLIGLASLLPGVLIGALVTFMAAFFLAKDKLLLINFIKSALPEEVVRKAVNVKTDLIKMFFGFLRAQIIIISVIYLMTSIGLQVIGYDYAFLIGLFISLVDIMPVLGTGSVLVPWALINLFWVHNYRNGIMIIVLYAIIVVVRQVMEPQLIGANIGLHPLVTLMSMYLGLNIFGIIGIILGPVIVITGKTLYKSGVIPSIKEFFEK